MLKLKKYYRLALASLFLFLLSSYTSAQPLRDRHEVIRSLVESGDYASALTALQELRTAEPAAFALNNHDYLMARLYERVGNMALAEENYQRVVARRSVLSQYALWHLSQLARVTGNLPLEREKLRQLISTAPESLLREAATARLGESFFESRDYASAILALRPRSSATGKTAAREALALLGEAYLRSNQREAAREAFSQLVAQLPNPQQPDDFALAGVRGLDALDTGTEEATGQRSAPQLAESEHMRRAQIYNFNRDFAGARRHYLAIVERYGTSASVAEALYMIARGFYQERNFADAIPYFQRVVKEHPDNSNARDALSFYAASLSRLQRTDEAINAYKTVIERYGTGTTLERAYLNIIDVLRDAGRDAEALSWVEQARNRFKGQTAANLALFSQARIHLSQGAWVKALADFDALRAESNLGGATTSGSTNQKEVAFMRAYALEQLGRTAEAINEYLAIPDGRNEYYGGRATRRLRALAADPKSRSIINARAEAFSAAAQKSLGNRQFEDARRAAQSALRLLEDTDLRKELLHLLQVSYDKLPNYNLPTPRLLPTGRQNVLAGGGVNPNASPTHKALADELLFLGLYDEGAPELAVAEKATGSASAVEERSSTPQDASVTGRDNPPPPAKPDATQSSPTLSRDEAYTLAVLYMRGDNANHAVRYAEPIWKKVPADYLLELAPREMVELLYPAPYKEALLEYAPPRKVDPRFVLSIMRQESRFRPEAKSIAAARGLLQFIPSTSNQIAAEVGLQDFRQDDLYNPRIAVLFGSQYMGNLFRQFPDMPQAVAASYNGGEDNVARWVARARSSDPDRYVLEIGFAQSKDYVYKVLPNYWVYQSLYTEQLKRR
jgi:soluble lytic murein transglycosylase